MRIHIKFFVLVFCFVFLSTPDVKAQLGDVDRDAKEKPKLIILGTYHMATTTSNVFNREVDDVTSPERQKQIIELVEKLKRFRPTKVVVECDIENDAKTNEKYKQYLAGNYQLTKNETNQIGFRLAKLLGHKKVYCVDWGIFPDDPIYNYEKYAAGDAELDSFLKEYRGIAKKSFDEKIEKLSTLPVTDQLILLNQPEQIDKDHQGYYEILRIGRNEEYSGADYLSWWYGRNFKILVNIIRITESPNDRILAVYGSGHTKLLTQFAKESGFYDVESPLKYLK